MHEVVFAYGIEIVYMPPSTWNNVRSPSVDSIGLAKEPVYLLITLRCLSL